MNELHLFAGAGGGILGGKLLGHTTVCAVEISEYRRKVLLQRQRDGILPRFPIWDDVTTFDGRPWRGRVDVVAGGFPCQDISPAGRRAGIKGERSGLWSEYARILGEVRPEFAFIENSSDLTIRGGHVVLSDLARLGYDAQWGVFSACSVGCPHVRLRLFLMAHAKVGRTRQLRRIECASESKTLWNLRWKEAESSFERVVDVVADRVDRLESSGDGQVPAVVALAWRTLLSRLSSCDSKTQ